MPTSCNTHDYDGKLREKWFEMRPMLIETYLRNCLSFDDTIKQIEEWLDKKYYNIKRIGRARRSIKILTSQRRSNFDSANDIDVEELLPILWDKVKGQEDIHDTFYEQLCDITGGSCSQGRSTRLFQFLFLFDLPTNTETSNQQETNKNSEEQQSNTDKKPEEEQQLQANLDKKPEEEQQLQAHLDKKPEEKQQQRQAHLENKTEEEQQQQHQTHLENKPEEKPDENRSSLIDENSDPKQQSHVDEKLEEEQQSLVDEKLKEEQQLPIKQEPVPVEEINSPHSSSSVETK